MSCAVEALIEQQMVMLRRNTIGLAQRLQQDYQAALANFHERCNAQDAAQAAARAEHHAADATASALAGLTITGDTATATQFLEQHVAHLAQRMTGVTDSGLHAQLAHLQHTLAATPDDFATLFSQYQRLNEALATAIAQRGTPQERLQALQAEIVQLHAELASPLLAADDCAELRAQCATQLEALAQLEPRQWSMAAQGIALLRSRIRRELALRAEALQQRAHASAHLRELTNELLAKLQTLAQQTELPDFAQQAQALLARVGTAMEQITVADLAPLEQLKEEADALFTATTTALEEQAVTSYVSDQVTDVLRSLGYQVAEIPADHQQATTLVTPLADDIGLEIRVDGQGHLGTHMVALSDDAAQRGHASQEKVCALVDEIFTALRHRDIGVRERFRSSLATDESLPVVAMPAMESETPATRQVAAKTLKVDEL